SLSHVLDRWSHREWDKICTSRELPCSIFFPPFVLEGVLDKAHLCTDLNNLKIITKGWEYFDKCGSGLLKFLTLCMTEYNNIGAPTKTSASDGEARFQMSPEANTLAQLMTVLILKALCRENGHLVSDTKDCLNGWSPILKSESQASCTPSC
ncbi:hypothetical protein K438DRAFT_1609252, partial [Mycena galopus ATCC 62051]